MACREGTENLAGRSLLNAQADTLYAVSESGVTVLPVGSLAQFHRLSADHEDLVFHGSFCQRGGIVQTLKLTDPGGGRTAFVVDRKYVEASYFAAAGAVLTFFGLMHGETVGFAVTPAVALAYAMVAAFLYVLSRMPVEAAQPTMIPKAVPAE